MTATLELEAKAVDFAKRGDFGDDALEANLELTQQAPSNQGAWTRLARCYEAKGDLEKAEEAFRQALELNPRNSIALNRLREIGERRRARSIETRSQSGIGGFSVEDFALLGSSSSDDALSALGPSFHTLFGQLNALEVAQQIARIRGGRGTLFQKNSLYAGGPGHLYAYHYNGRWTPQFNLGIFAPPKWGDNWFRIGLGFNLTAAGRDPNREERQAEVIAHFERFQGLVARTWRTPLTDWMLQNSGYIQYGDRDPALDKAPGEAVEWLATTKNYAQLGWIFVGRWLFLDRDADRRILESSGALTRTTADVFRSLMPLWRAVVE